MTLRACLVGNSHVAAFKRGWDMLAAEFPDVSIDFFGAPGQSITDVSVVDGMIVAEEGKAANFFRQIGGKSTVCLADYDMVIIVGCGVRSAKLMQMLKQYLPPFLNPALAGQGASGQAGPDAEPLNGPFKADAPHTLISSSLLNALYASRIRHSAAYELVDGISRDSRCALYYVPTPMPSSEILTLKPKNIVSQLALQGHGNAFMEAVWKAFETAMHGKCKVVRTPEHMIVDGMLTDKQFSSGATRLGDDRGGHQDDDLNHMNGDYGKILLRQILSEQIVDIKAERVSAH